MWMQNNKTLANVIPTVSKFVPDRGIIKIQDFKRSFRASYIGLIISSDLFNSRCYMFSKYLGLKLSAFLTYAVVGNVLLYSFRIHANNQRLHKRWLYKRRVFASEFDYN